MNEQDNSKMRQDDHDTIITLVAEVKNLTDAVEKMSNKMDDYSHTFVPREEFNQLSVLVKGVAGSGGMLKQVEKLENKVTRYVVILGIAWTILTIVGVAGWQYFLARYAYPVTNTTINTSSK